MFRPPSRKRARRVETASRRKVGFGFRPRIVDETEQRRTPILASVAKLLLFLLRSRPRPRRPNEISEHFTSFIFRSRR